MNKRLVIINQSTGFLMIDVANAYLKKYNEVVLITGRVSKLERELDSNIEIDKIIPYNKKNAYTRLFTWIWGTIQIFFKLFIKYRKAEVLYVTNPPLSYLLSCLIKNPFSILVYDTYPDALKNIGISERNIIYKIWSSLNKIIFPKAKIIFTLSEGMAQNLSKYVSKEKITIIPNWSGSEKIKPISIEKNVFLQNKLFKNDFIILYSGNLGYTHNLEIIMEVAKKLRNEKDIHFLFIGEGKKKKDLIKTADNYDLTNCSFLTWQEADIMPYSLASAHLGVVTLNEETAHLSVPSKTYNLLAAGVPLLSISPHKSEISNLIQQYQNGRNFTNLQIDEICEFILLCRGNSDLMKKMSSQSLLASKDFTYENALLYLKN